MLAFTLAMQQRDPVEDDDVGIGEVGRARVDVSSRGALLASKGEGGGMS